MAPMQCVVQRVSEARVTVAGEVVGQIQMGLVGLAAVVVDDDERDIDWMAGKLVGLRVFRDGEKHFEVDVTAVGGAILLVSNFTVSADARKGRRPSFDRAAKPEVA